MIAEPPAGAFLALDVGGTKIAAALVGYDGSLLRVVRTPTPVGAGPDGVFAVVVELLRDVAGYSAIAGVGVACGGPMVWPEGVVSPLNLPDWRSFPLRAALAATYPGVPVRVHNDAVCVAIGEHWQGAGRGVANMLGMVVSTGVGGGLLLDDHLVSGATGNAGHIGHVIVDPSGPPCACGGRGCLEAVASGPRIVRWALDRGWRSPTGIDDGEALAASALSGDAVASAAFGRAGWALGVAIASAVHLTDVALVVVGGGLAQAGDLLFAPLRRHYAEHAGLDFAKAPRVVPATLGTAAGLVGAGGLILVAERYWTAV